MRKKPVDPNWFSRLKTIRLREHLSWLGQLDASVERIANFGCWSSEPFALLWTLDAREIMVIEKNEKSLNERFGPKEELEILRKVVPAALEARTVEFIVADMCTRIDELPSDHFDLAYCEDVLYYMEPDSEELRGAIVEMARVVKPGGWVIAVEPKAGVEFEKVPIKLFSGVEVCVPEAKSKPVDISLVFEMAGLTVVTLENAPDWSYCCKK